MSPLPITKNNKQFIYHVVEVSLITFIVTNFVDIL